MAKSKTSTNGAVAAADDYIQEASAKIAKHHDTITAHRESLEAELAEVKAKAAADAIAYAKEISATKASMQREIDGLFTRATKAETKVAAAFGKLAE